VPPGKVWSIIACKHRKSHIIQIHRRTITHLWDCRVNNNTMKAGNKHANSGENQNKHICNYYPLTLWALDSGYKSVYNRLLQISGKQFYRNLHAEFLSHFWMEWEDWVVMLDSRANLKSQPYPHPSCNKLARRAFFHLNLPLYKKHLISLHREAYIDG
jgi:hypothetical protein